MLLIWFLTWPAILLFALSLIGGVVISSLRNKRVLYATLISIIGSTIASWIMNDYARRLCSIDGGPICPLTIQNVLKLIPILAILSFITIYLGVFVMHFINKILKK